MATATVTINGQSLSISGLFDYHASWDYNEHNPLIQDESLIGKVHGNYLTVEAIGNYYTGEPVFSVSGRFGFLGPGIDTSGILNISPSTFIAAPSTIPLPAALPLFATGLGAMGLIGWRRRWKAAFTAA